MREIQGRTQPPSLVIAAGLTVVQGLFVFVFAMLEAAHVHADRATMGVTTSLFFGLLGLAMLACAWYLVRGRTWARSPIVVVQVLWLGLAWNFVGGATTWIAVVLAVAATAVLVGVLHPASLEALGDGREEDHT